MVTRGKGYLPVLPKVKLELGRQSFNYSGAKMFNQLPLSVRKATTTSAFDKLLEEFFES